MRLNPPIATLTAEAARNLRQGMTDAEQRVWARLRAKRLGGLHFRRQHPVPPYVVDFCCVSAKLVVELDGSQHHEDRDGARDSYLVSQGFQVLRFWNNDAMQRLDDVLGAILDAARVRTLSPDPSPDGRGERIIRGE
jgi:very-short-patch-repair endonuclease